MKRPEIMLWMVVVAVVTMTLAGLGERALSAKAHSRAAVASWRQLTDHVREYRRLEAATAALPVSQRGPSLAELVADALAASGLPPGTLSSLSPDSAQPGTGPLLRLRAGMTLSKLTLPQLGRFLSEWRQRQLAAGGWTITGIELGPETGADDVGASGGAAASGGAGGSRDTGRDLPLRAVMTLESIAVQGGEP